MNKQLYSVKNLRKKYSNNIIINDVSFAVEKEKPMLIKGPSGCGKTTLLRCMCFLEEIQEGEIIFSESMLLKPNQKPQLNKTNRKRISMVFQSLYLWNHLSVLQNVALPLVTNGLSRLDAEKKAHAMLDDLNLSRSAASTPSSLSGGQMQRVALARALVHSPDVLLLDEITANLDDSSSQLVFSAIEKILDKSISVVTVSHSDKIPAFLQKDRLEYIDNQWMKNP